ncbi:acyl-CoA N-acyltransferase [Setomelanomma holmii]|uniref:Acyl-CoA N-acyltransferase n=1 Tax=Setomelanomma holmii TaxID=210430 RepID=A0A9P4HK70_9PLEO|nr:acyl-CoA N-acyltransferase [Setomelanomma holmii]
MSISTTTTSLTTLDPNFVITTPRLRISHFIPTNIAHADLILYVRHSPSSVKFQPSGPSLIPDRAAAQAFIASGADRMVHTGYGRYAVSLRPEEASTISPATSQTQSTLLSSDGPTPQPDKEDQSIYIGAISCNLARYPDNPGPTVPDIGFNFLPAYHGRGYATEALFALMQYYRETKGCRAFAGITNPENGEAKRLLARLGFQDRGVRGVSGVLPGGNVDESSVWTLGVGEGEETLTAVRL